MSDDAAPEVLTEEAPAVEEAQPKPQGDTPDPVEAEAGDKAEAKAEESQDSGEDSAEKDKRRNAVQERINQLTRQKRELEQRAIDAEARTRMLEERFGGNNETPKFPSLEEFDYDQDKYQSAVADFYTKQQQRAVQDHFRQQHQMEVQIAQQEAAKVAAEAFRARSDAFAEAHPDYREKVTNPAFAPPQVVQQAILLDDNGPALAYHLASNQEAAARINSLPPELALMELGKISSRLSTPPKPKPTQTPQPVKPVSPAGSIEKDPGDMSPKEFHEMRLKQRGFI